jgi:hypothetical protein
VTGSSNIGTGVNAGGGVNGSNNIATGSFAGQNVTGDFNTATGFFAGRNVVGDGNIALGENAGGNIGALAAPVNDSIAVGTGASATASNAIAIGTGALATGSIAVGNQAFASNGGAAFGDFSTASGTDSTALGPNTMASGNGAVAIGSDSGGTGATASLDTQVVLGPASHSYTAPGIASAQSRARQSGPLEVVTSDTAGNLATDGGEIFRRLDDNQAGIALAMSMQNPDLAGEERFGVAANWGTFEGAHALSVSLMGVLGEDVFAQGDRVAVSGGFGGGFQYGRGKDVYGGRVGLQWTR